MKMSQILKLASFVGLAAFMGTLMPRPSAEAALSNPVGSQTDPAINAEYIMVINNDTLAHEVGDVLVYVDSTYDGINVSSTTTAANPLVAGVVAVADIPASGAGLLQVSGYHSGVTVGVAVTAGDSLTTSTTGEAAGILTIATATTTVTAQESVFGTVFATAVTSTTCKAIIRLQ